MGDGMRASLTSYEGVQSTATTSVGWNYAMQKVHIVPNRLCYRLRFSWCLHILRVLEKLYAK